MNDGLKKLALAGLGLIRLSGKESSGIIDKLAAIGGSVLNTEVVPNEPLSFDVSGYRTVMQLGTVQASEMNLNSAASAVSESVEAMESTEIETKSDQENE